jgi:FkbM family methyltransferase
MKAWVKKILQQLLGFDHYLYLFSLYIINTLKWNKKEGDFIHFLEMIPNKGRILDIGANIGIMSVWLGRNRPEAEIFAYEPIPHNIKALKKVLAHYKLKNVQVIEKALGNNNGEVEMVMPVLDEVKMQGLSHVVHESITDFNQGIKLDVENFEYFVLKGACQTISKYRPIIYTELWENENREKCFKLMNELNYKVKILQKKTLVDFDPTMHKTQNFFFVP